MDFDSLVGKEFDFYGVDNNNFKLDGTVWEAIEDESDGYRSYLETVERKDETGLIFFSLPLATVRLTYTEDEFTVDKWYSRRGNFYNLVDVKTGHVWVKFGTDNYDDYYPCFVFYYEPQA